MEGNDILFDYIIQASPEAVFDAISTPEGLNSWWALKSSGKPEIGAEYNLNFTDTYNWFGKVIKCEPGSSFHIQMTATTPEWEGSSFGFDIQPHEKGSYVTFGHRNWKERGQAYRYSAFCWAMLLKGLRDYVERGIVVPFEDRE